LQDEANDVATGDLPAIIVAALHDYTRTLEDAMARYAKEPLSSETVDKIAKMQRHVQTLHALTHRLDIAVSYGDCEE
jgi:hypothetical protein